ncbi:hypothetical protein ACFOOP_17880 [Marinicaulis aureus]|uniref:Uncharacterized protein n=1 Tax=Hyphococcus aureus TaxID=2666033 RepID=A0ABW1KVV3_9PROT
MRLTGGQSDEQATIDQVRINVAFEQMVFAVFTGAAAGGALTFLLALARSLFGGFFLSGVVSQLLESLLVSILIFLAGFVASVIFGAPLFAALEKRKRRNVWPYLGAASGVAIAVFVLLAISVPGAASFSLDTIAAIFAPALVIAIVFAQGMKPHWRAAEKAEAEAEGPVIFRIH